MNCLNGENQQLSKLKQYYKAYFKRSGLDKNPFMVNFLMKPLCGWRLYKSIPYKTSDIANMRSPIKTLPLNTVCNYV